MARVALNQTSFTTGEVSPRALGRTDIDRYSAALKKARNGHPVVTGGFKRRDGSLYVAAASTNDAGASRLVPFIKGRDQAWMLEFGNLNCKVYALDGTFTGVTLTTPYTSVMLPALDFTQSEATLYIFHIGTPIQRLQLIGTATWVITAAPFTTVPFAEVGLMPSAELTLSAASVGVGRTVTAAGPTFLASDVGRGIIYDSGIAVITAYTSTTVVTAEVTRAFPSTTVPGGQWTLEGSPQTTLTPSAKDPVGATITLTLGAAGWRSGDVSSMVRVNGGLVQISGFTSDTIVNATIRRELTGTTAAPALAWTLEPAVWSATYGYPRTGTIHQQRLIAAGNVKFPRTVWGSRIGEPLDYELGTVDDQAFAFTIDSDESSAISYVTSSRDLIVLTESCEYSLRGGVEKPITPTNVRVVPESNHGCAAVRPQNIGRETMFVQRAGRKIRALGYRYDFDGYAAPDIMALAEHLSKGGVSELVYQQEPDLMLWARRADGKFLTCTIDRDQSPSVVGWAQHETDGTVDSLASAPYVDREVVWAIVRRTVGGVPVRYIERFDGTMDPQHASESVGRVYGCTVDCGKIVDNAVAATVITGLAHLEGRSVVAVGDGAALGAFTVASGQITIPIAHKRVLVGLHFRSEAQLLTPEVGTQEGSAQGSAARTAELTMRFLDTIGATVEHEGDSQVIPFRQFGGALLDQPPEPFTGLVRVSTLGWARGVSELSVVQDQPLPMHLLGVIRKHTANP